MGAKKYFSVIVTFLLPLDDKISWICQQFLPTDNIILYYSLMW